MAQADYTIADQAGASFRAELNDHLAAIVSQNSGLTAPSTTFAYQWWADTTTGILKQRNAANSAWIDILTLSSGAAKSVDGSITSATTATTQSVNDNSTKVATTAYADRVGKDRLFDVDATVAANAMTLTINPTVLDFRSTTLTDGTPVTRTISAAITMTVSSGSTLGTTSAVQSDIAILAIDNAGTVEVACVNISGGNDLSETGLITTTAEGGAGAADSATVYYSTTARTNVAYRVVGLVRSTQTTAGTWAQTLTVIPGGGNALTAMSSLGYGQTWQAVTRNPGTTYYNTTGKPIAYNVFITNSAGSMSHSVSVNGGTAFVIVQTSSNAGNSAAGSTIIPAGASYVFSEGGSVGSRTAFELR